MSLLRELSLTPLPELVSAVTALDYHEIPISTDHRLSQESLVDVEDFGISAESFYARSDGWNAPYFSPIRSSLRRVWCRKSVAERLAKENEQLRRVGIEFHILDGYRPVDCQQALWDFFIDQARKTLPNPTEEACRRFVGQYWSDPSKFDPEDFRTWPTHATGGAIDLTLRRVKTGELLYMGGIFDDTSEFSHARFYEENAKSDSLSVTEAQRNRRILFWTMINAGFANYSYEWWHYDLGNQMWVMNRSIPGRKEDLIAYYGLAMETEMIKHDRVG